MTKAILFKLYVIPGLFIMTYAITGQLYESLLLLIIAIVGGFLFFIGFDKLWRMEHGMKKRLTYAITYLIFFAGVAVVCILEGKKGGGDDDDDDDEEEEEPELYELDGRR